jgi:phage/plasmid-associated DNA primase
MSQENCLNLTLTRSKNILDGITLYEPVDVSILDKLINSHLLRGSELYEQFKFNNKFKTEKQQLLKYRELIEDGRAKVVYKRSNNPFGRSNPDNGLGLFQIRREIRHTLTSDSMEDIDIDNCHPVLLEQILTFNNINCDNLRRYIENRNEYLKKVQDHYSIDKLPEVIKNPHLLKDIAKNLFIRILYSGGVYRWKNDNNIKNNIPTPDFITDLENEIKIINEKIVEANPELVDIIKKLKIDSGKMDKDGFCPQTIEEKEEGKPKRKYNINGSVSSYFLQEKEITILSHIFLYCKEKNYIKNDNCVLCADGIMIEKYLYKPELLNELKDIIKLKTGFIVNFSNKVMDQGYNKILDDRLNFDLYTPIFTSGLLADYFKVIYANKFINVNNQVYIYTGVYWKKEEDKKNSTLHNFIDSIFFKHLLDYISKKINLQNKYIGALPNTEENEMQLQSLRDELEKMTEFLKNITNGLRKVKQRKDLVEDIINKITVNYIEFDKYPFYYTFKNKIWDLQNKNWIEPRYNQYISMTTGWDWCDYYPESNINELDSLINTIFPVEDVKKHYLMALSTGLYGQQIEKLFIATGRGGNGKSLLNGLMMTASGEYAYKLPSNVLLNSIKEGPNPEVAGMDLKRFVLVQEPDNNKVICSSTLKEITGDPTLNARKCHSNNTKTTLLLSLFLECNDELKMDEINDAVIRRVDVTPFVSKFVSQSVYNEIPEATRKEKNIMIGNAYYKSVEFQQKYKQALIQTLFNYFDEFKNDGFEFKQLPKECKEATKEYMALSDDIYTWFAEFYEKETGEEDKKSFIYYDDLFEIFTQSKLYNNMTKKDKRDYNLKKFTKKIDESMYFTPYIRKRDTKYEGIKHKRTYIVGFKKVVKVVDEEIIDKVETLNNF